MSGLHKLSTDILYKHGNYFYEEYAEELYKKDLHDPHNHHGVIT